MLPCSISEKLKVGITPLQTLMFCPSQEKCNRKRVEFFYYKDPRGQSLKGHVRRVALVKPILDMALLEINFSNLGQFESPPPALSLSSKLPRYKQPLAVMGYGVNRNEYGILMVEAGGDCRVFSRNSDIRKIKDPDTINPFPYLVYSFLIGCDISHGDSGSPIFDVNTGKVLGLLWTGRVPKAPRISKKGFEKLPYSFFMETIRLCCTSSIHKKYIKKIFPFNRLIVTKYCFKFNRKNLRLD